MLKFNAWPPEPGQVELVSSFKVFKPHNADMYSHYRQMGVIVGRMLEVNMPERDLNAVEAIATELIAQDSFANRVPDNGLTGSFLDGVSIVMRSEAQRSTV